MSSFTVSRSFKLKVLTAAVATAVVFELLAFVPLNSGGAWTRLAIVALMTTGAGYVAAYLTGCFRIAWTVLLSEDGSLWASTWLNLREWTVPVSTIWLIEAIESRYAPYGGRPLIQAFRSIEINHAHGMFRVSRHLNHLGELIEAIKRQNPQIEVKNRLDWPPSV